jgi:hypothetical protein
MAKSLQKDLHEGPQRPYVLGGLWEKALYEGHGFSRAINLL